VQCFVLAAGLLQVDALHDGILLELGEFFAQILQLHALFSQVINLMLLGICEFQSSIQLVFGLLLFGLNIAQLFAQVLHLSI